MNYNNVTNKTIRSTTPISKLTFFLANHSMIPTSQSIQSPAPSQYNISTNKIGSSMNTISHKNPQPTHSAAVSQQVPIMPISGQYSTPKNSYQQSSINRLIHSNPDIYQQLKQRQMDYINLIKDLHLQNCRLRTMLNNHQISPQIGTQSINGQYNDIQQVMIKNSNSYTVPNMNPSDPINRDKLQKQSANRSSRSKINGHTRTPSFNSPEKSIPPAMMLLSPSLKSAVGSSLKQANQNVIVGENYSLDDKTRENMQSENLGSVYSYIQDKVIISPIENHSIFSSNTNQRDTFTNMVNFNKQQSYPNRKISIDNHNTISYGSINPNINVNIKANSMKPMNNNSSVMIDNNSIEGESNEMRVPESLKNAAQRFSFADRQEKVNSNLMNKPMSKQTLQTQPTTNGTSNMIRQSTNQQNIWKIKTNKSIPYPCQDQQESGQNQSELAQNNTQIYLRIKNSLNNQGIANNKDNIKGSIGARAYVDATDQEQSNDPNIYINSNTPSIKYYMNSPNHNQHLDIGTNQKGRMKIMRNKINNINSNAYTNFDENQYSCQEQDRTLQYSPSLPNQTSYSSIPSLLQSNTNSIYANMERLKQASDSIKNQETHADRRSSGFSPFDTNNRLDQDNTFHTQNIHANSYDKIQGYDRNVNRLQKIGIKDKRKYIKNSVYL